MRPLQISPDTAVKLAEQLNIPLEQLMHMPQHILLQKLAELNASEDKKDLNNRSFFFSIFVSKNSITFLLHFP